jgi:chromosome segregation ATPase
MFEEYAVVFLDETDADDLPRIVRHQRVRRRRTAEELDAARAEAARAQSNGAGEIATTNGHGEDAAPTMTIEAGTVAEHEVDGEDVDGSETSIIDLEFVEEVVVSDPMSVPHPAAHAEVSEDRWAPILEGFRRQLANFGPVNEMAVEDYDERKERLTFLVTQRDDLVRAREGLIETIRKVNKEARERFMATFEQAKKNFIEVHEVLFPGGRADLTLEGDDPLEGDIVMSARPQGKRVESIKLLSSGERALTAIALLFSIYMIKPSPFCILDEVDAPLDDANIDRFVRLVRQFATRTQFVIITHNKRTMEACNSLYGVTMEEPGISKLVSVKFHGGDVTVDGVARPDLVTT